MKTVTLSLSSQIKLATRSYHFFLYIFFFVYIIITVIHLYPTRDSSFRAPKRIASRHEVGSRQEMRHILRRALRFLNSKALPTVYNKVN